MGGSHEPSSWVPTSEQERNALPEDLAVAVGEPIEQAIERPSPSTLTQQWVCPNCDGPNEEQHDCCNKCGELRPGKWICPKCDEPNRQERERCNNCSWLRGSSS